MISFEKEEPVKMLNFWTNSLSKKVRKKTVMLGNRCKISAEHLGPKKLKAKLCIYGNML